MQYVTITEAAEKLGITRQAIYSRIDSGRVKLARVKVEKELVVWDDEMEKESRSKTCEA